MDWPTIDEPALCALEEKLAKHRKAHGDSVYSLTDSPRIVDICLGATGV